MLTIPNILTILRVIMIPFFIYCLMQNDSIYRWWALVLFILASVTDFLDGYLARKLKQDSALGRFLDPFADKALVVSTIVAFVYLDKQIPLWMVLVIIGRDLLITVMRFLAIRKGMEVKTSKLAKFKTAFQMISIFLILGIFLIRSYRTEIINTFEKGRQEGKKNLDIALDSFAYGLKIITKKEISSAEKEKVFAESMPYFVMLITTIFTIISGLRYIYTNYKILLPPYYIFARRAIGKE